MWLFYIVFGLVIAFTGKRTIWGLVGIAGFLVGLWFATTIWNPDSTSTTWIEVVVAIIVGLLGAALAKFFGKIAIAGAGFVAGGYGLTALAQAGMVNLDPPWLTFVIGGFVGLLLVGFVFDWALIGLTAWIGAGLVINGLSLQGTSAFLVFGLVFLLGSLAQLRGDSPLTRRRRKIKEENN